MTQETRPVLALVGAVDEVIDRFVLQLIGAPQAPDLDAVEIVYDLPGWPAVEHQEISRAEIRAAVVSVFGEPVYRRVFGRLRDIGVRERKTHGRRLFVLPRLWRLSRRGEASVELSGVDELRRKMTEDDLLAAAQDMRERGGQDGDLADVHAELARRYRERAQ